MAEYTLQNDFLTLTAQTHGGEIASIQSKNGGEYIWCADPSRWARHAPVLFPFVGSARGKKYRHNGQEYDMPQHGFARDNEFSLLSLSEEEIWFRFSETEETLKKYPFRFQLDIGYRLSDRKVTTFWRVTNKNDGDLWFSIGGHPAFNLPFNGIGARDEYLLKFDTEAPLSVIPLKGGLADKENTSIYKTDRGFLPITPELFANDALILQDNQVHQVALCTPDRKPLVTVSFDAPLCGLWSASADCPFVCIEPWYGRCDAVDYDGDLSHREWEQCLKAGETFTASFTMEFSR
jgi:galactose mutarotase-like enzyme